MTCAVSSSGRTSTSDPLPARPIGARGAGAGGRAGGGTGGVGGGVGARGGGGDRVVGKPPPPLREQRPEQVAEGHGPPTGLDGGDDLRRGQVSRHPSGDIAQRLGER